jgi:hypothetical protein
MTIRSAITLLTASVALVTAYSTVRPDLITIPRGILPALFGICLAVFVSIDSSNRVGGTRQFPSQALDIRQSSRLIYLWLYLLVGVNELAAWWCNYPLEAAANKLGGFLIAGIVVLVLIRIPAAIRPIRRTSILKRSTATFTG